MAMADAKVNFNFEESRISDRQVLITNNSGRVVSHLELVVFDGYFGEVTEFADIANSAQGMINIDSDRHIYTSQINITDTFVLKGIVYLTTTATITDDVLRAEYVSGSVAVGICTKISSGVAIEFKPFAQKGSGANGINLSTYEVDADRTTAVVITGLVPLGAKIIDAWVECKASNASGTILLNSNNASPVAITSAIVCAVDNVLSRTSLLTNDIVDADGLEVIANGAADRGILNILWR